MRYLSAFLLLSFTCVSLLLAGTAWALSQPQRFPIADLGSCRDAQECYWYCEVPANKAACWSYEKYVMNAQVRGTTTEADADIEAKARAQGITFPIAELGNCGSANECRAYCDNASNQQACIQFAQKHNLQGPSDQSQRQAELLAKAQAQLGCASEEACRTFCQNPDNHLRCEAFAREHTPEQYAQHSQRQQEMIKRAQEFLGCDSKASCEAFCQNPANQEKCMTFAEKYAPPEIRERHKERLLQQVQQQLPCNSFESCRTFCSNPGNQAQCTEFAQKTMPEKYLEHQRRMQQQSEHVLPCDSFESCQRLCQNTDNKEQCQQFNDPSGQMRIHINQERDFTCASPDECRDWCQSNPDKCPGYKESSDYQRLQEPSPYPGVGGQQPASVFRGPQEEAPGQYSLEQRPPEEGQPQYQSVPPLENQRDGYQYSQPSEGGQAQPGQPPAESQPTS